MTWILDTPPSYAFIFLRLGLAVTFFFHSTQHIFGWFGGHGVKGHLANWRDKYAIPVPIGALGSFIEFFGSFALLTGCLTRPFALGLALFIAIAIVQVPLGARLFPGAPPRRRQRHRVHPGAASDGRGAVYRRRRRFFRGPVAKPLG